MYVSNPDTVRIKRLSESTYVTGFDNTRLPRTRIEIHFIA